MTKTHKNWRKFCKLLSGKSACDFKKGTWRCNGSTDRPFARRILESLGADVELSLSHFDRHGGYCDCEILFNVDR